MSIRIRVTALSAVAVMGALGLTACGNVVTSPGAAALVGDFRISVDALQNTVDRALANPQAKAKFGDNRAAFARLELARLIENRVIAAAAAAHRVAVTPAEVDQQMLQFAQQAGGVPQLEQQAAQGGVPKQDLRTFVRYYVLQQKLGDALVANQPVSQQQLQAAYQQNIDQFDQVHSAHILVKDKKTADKILAQVRQNPGSFAALAARYSIDTGSKNNGGDLGFAGRGQFVKPFSDAIFAAKPGSFVEAHSKFGWHVIHVIAHRKVSLQQATAQLKAQILKQQRDQLLQQALASESKKLGVHVNPRYGTWNAARAEITPVNPSNDVVSPSPGGAGSG